MSLPSVEMVSLSGGKVSPSDSDDIPQVVDMRVLLVLECQ